MWWYSGGYGLVFGGGRGRDMEEASTSSQVWNIRVRSSSAGARTRDLLVAFRAKRENGWPLPNCGFSLRSDLTLNSTAPRLLEIASWTRDYRTLLLFILFIFTTSTKSIHLDYVLTQLIVPRVEHLFHRPSTSKLRIKRKHIHIIQTRKKESSRSSCSASS